jgi:crotonobetainyl-CoA:carnitine CoA-transferase CaiB-like acyl-CoA transferase
MSEGPLKDVRVVDFCHFLAGPFATMTLADLGADVIKVEDPRHPDEARAVGPCFYDGQSLYYGALNWGKRSFGVQVAKPEGRAALMELVKTADVMIDNYSPGVMARLGLDHETLAVVNPRIITCSVTGFGETGPYTKRPGYDYTIQALAGVMSLTGEPDGPPGKAGISYVDHSGGLAAALAVTAALVERGRTGTGRHIDVALYDVQIAMLTYLAAWQLNDGFMPGRHKSGAHPSLVPAQTFETADGHASIFVGNDPMWQRLVEAMGDQRLRSDAYATIAGRFEQRDEVLALLEEVFRKRSTEDWIAVLTEARVPCAPVNTIEQAMQDPHTEGRDLIVASGEVGSGYRHTRGPLPALGHDESLRRPAPRLGQDTTELLKELGYDQAEIERLHDGGAILSVAQPQH